MKCPHCLIDFNDAQTRWSVALGADAENSWILTRRHCPTCNRFIFALENGHPQGALPIGTQNSTLRAVSRTFQVWPKGTGRAPVPSEVPKGIADDYREACLVLADSPKASAALSRRCLQTVLREAGKVKPADLNDEIEEIRNRGMLPSQIADELDVVRVIGNFGAHPIKSKVTGQIVEVEPHEAEWNLDVLESLFDFYYVLPAKAQAKKDALNKKLSETNKPPVK